MSWSIQCDACRKIFPGYQPNKYVVEPESWFTAVEDAPGGGSRRVSPHACSVACYAELRAAHPEKIWTQVNRLNPDGTRKQPRNVLPDGTMKPKVGRENCRSCAMIRNGAPCIFHRPKGWKTMPLEQQKTYYRGYNQGAA